MTKPYKTFVFKRAFTLVEVLVSLTVLSLLVFLVANITSSATIGITGGQKRTAADSEARTVFNRLAIDLARMVRRVDMNFDSFKRDVVGFEQLGNDSFSFYSEVPGYSTFTYNNLSPYSMVRYQADSGIAFFPGTVLQRASKGLAWERPINVSALPTFDPADYKILGSQVFRIEYTYLKKATSSSGPVLAIDPGSLEGLKDVSAIVVGIAVLDSSNRALGQSAGGGSWNDTDLVDKFADVANGNDILATWMPEIASGRLVSNAGTLGIPVKVAEAVKVYQRYFYLDKQ